MTADIAAIRARWAAVQVGDWTRWTAADLGSVCRLSSATLTAVLHAPDDVRTLLHEARRLTAERDAFRDLATDLASHWPDDDDVTPPLFGEDA